VSRGPLHTRSSGPCGLHLAAGGPRSYSLVTRFCYALKRQIPPGCKKGPAYLSGRRRAEARYFLEEPWNPASVSPALIIWAHWITALIGSFY
jgi:hypothetical protein